MRTSLPPLHLHSCFSLILKRLSPFIQPAFTFQLLYFLWSQFPQFSPYSNFSCTLVLYLWVYSVAKYEAVHFLPIFMFFFFFLSKHLWAGIRSCLFSSVHVTCNSFSVFVGFSFLSFFFFFFGCFNQTLKVWMQRTCYIKLAAMPYFFMNSDIWRHGI